MQPSSLVFVAIVVGWAAYLLPQWLRRREALTQSHGPDRHSSGLRLLDRRRRRSPGPSSVPLLTDPRGLRLPESDAARPAVAAPAPASPAAIAAKRRARVLGILMACTTGSWALAPLGRVGVWGATAVTGLLLLDLVALVVTGRRRAVRRAAAERARRAAANRRRHAAAVRRATSAADRTRRPAEPTARAAEPQPAPVAEPEQPEPAAARVARELACGGTPWVPVPVPPPTYTLKPSVPRPEPAPLDLPDPTPPRPDVPAASDAPAASTSDARTPRPWDAARTFADDLDLDAVLARRRAVGS